jgi:predicted RNase H-like HicB family nuclease
MREFFYPARFTRDRKDGGYVVSFRDVPEAITQADSLAGCHEEAAGALQVDPHHATKAERLERALAVLGRHAELRVA